MSDVEPSSDYLVRPEQNRLRNRYADLLCRLQVEDQLELRRLLDRQIGGLGTFQNFVNVGGGAPEQFGTVRSICHKTTKVHEFLHVKYRRQAPLCCNVGDPV